MSLVRIITGTETVVRRTGGKRYFFKPVESTDKEPVINEVPVEDKDLIKLLDDALDPTKEVKFLEGGDTSLVNMLDTAFESETENEINEAIEKEWSKE